MSDKKLSLLVNFISIDKITGTMKGIVGLGRDGSKSIKALTGETKKLDNQMGSLQKKLAASIQSNSANMTELMAQHRQLAAEIARVNAQLERQKRLAVISADHRTMQRHGAEMRDRGSANMMGGVGMATPFILASKQAMDFSSGMVDIQQKANLTNAETAAMTVNILRLGKAAHQMPEDMRAAVDVLASRGMDPRQAVQMVGAIGRLGTAFKVELADGAAAAYANIDNLKVPIAETSRALDIMAAAGNAGAFEVKDMARHFPGLTAQMGALGQKGTPAVADLSAALQIAFSSARDADEAANNISGLLSKIYAPDTVEKFAKVGINVFAEMEKAAKKGITPLEEIALLTQRATKGDLKKIGNFFGEEQSTKALQALIPNMDKYRQMRAQISKADGTTDRAFAQREAQDATVKWRDFMGSVQRLGIVLGNGFLPAATQFMDATTGMMTAVGEFAQANPGLTSTLMMLAGGAVAARIAVGGLQWVFGGLIGPIADAIKLFRTAKELGTFATIASRTASIAGTAFSILRTGALFLARGVMQAGMMMLANPVVAAIVGIIAVVGLAGYMIYTHWDTIKAAFNQGIAWVTAKLTAAKDWLSNLGSMMMQGLLLALNPALLANKLIQIARSGITAFKNFFGIKSPSRLMLAMGGHITTGLSRGIDGGAGDPILSARRMANGVAAAGTPPMIGAGRITPARGAGITSGPAPTAGPITIQVYGAAGQSVDALADAVIRRIEQKTGVRARSSHDGGR
ncbi:phage tail tape measure protein [Novosphingobium sp. FSY-8]|uniref:Phage tail tape measure protein n=1 Tax=Novosphingobium ovatum TaxID=1908523 RepID=A0ABW9XAH8_9SPHN|nr:phage tail tape measure protein [Novosphingobium ovatum]NBC35533.1 phage tail tape measure protein [Novosphingobium ovatum]